MKKIKLLLLVLGLGLLVGTRLVPASSFAQNATMVTASDSVQPTANAQQEEKVFQGEIRKAKDGSYVLLDTASKAVYMLDDQEKVKQFEGKKVKVTGKLDEMTKTIQVADIEAA